MSSCLKRRPEPRRLDPKVSQRKKNETTIRVEGLGFAIQGLGLIGFRGLGCTVQGLGLRV